MTRTKQTILVADDDEDFVAMTKILLEAQGYEVLAAGGQKEAGKLLAGRSVSLAIVDLMMEHEDGGFALCYHIKKKDPAIPVILVTGVTSETGLEFDAATDEERKWVKADVMLAKPVRAEQMRREITRLLAGKD